MITSFLIQFQCHVWGRAATSTTICSKLCSAPAPGHTRENDTVGNRSSQQDTPPTTAAYSNRPPEKPLINPIAVLDGNKPHQYLKPVVQNASVTVFH